MRAALTVLIALCAACALPAFADGGGTGGGHKRAQLSSRQCGFGTPYDVLVDSGGVWLRRDQGTPREIFFHGGELSVDRQVRPVGDADAQRLRQLEHGAQQLVPQVAGIARAAADIAFDALSGVVEALTGSRRKARRIEEWRRQTQDYVDATLGRGRWEQALFDEGFEAGIEQAAEQMAGAISRSVLWTVFTGGAGRIEARTERMEQELEARIEARSRTLESQAQSLCAQVRSLYAIQQSLEYRYQGQPLRMLEIDDEAPSTSPREDDGDSARSRAVTTAE